MISREAHDRGEILVAAVIATPICASGKRLGGKLKNENGQLLSEPRSRPATSRKSGSKQRGIVLQSIHRALDTMPRYMSISATSERTY